LAAGGCLIAIIGALSNLRRTGDIFSPRVIIPIAVVGLYWLGFLSSDVHLRDPAVARVIFIGQIGFLFGFLISRSHFMRLPYDFNLPRNKPAIDATLLVLWLLGTFGFLVIVFQAGVPILRDDLQNYRFEMQSDVSYFGFVNLLYKSYIIYIYLSAIELLRRERHAKNDILIIIGLLTALIALASFGNRGLVFFPIVTVLVIYHYLRRPLGLISILVGGPIIILLATSIGYYRLKSGDIASWGNLLEWAIHELSVPSDNLSVITRLFPDQHAYMLGRGVLAPLATILPGKQYLLDWYLKDLSGLKYTGGGLPPTLFGLFYIDFGFIGVFFGSAFLGGILVRLWRAMQKSRNPISLVMYAFAIETVIVSFRNSLTIDAFLAFAVLIFIALRYVRTIGRRATAGTLEST